MQVFKLRLGTHCAGLHRVEPLTALDLSEALRAARHRIRTSQTFDRATLFAGDVLLAEVDQDGSRAVVATAPDPALPSPLDRGGQGEPSQGSAPSAPRRS